MMKFKRLTTIALAGVIISVSLLLTGCPLQHVDSLYGVKVAGDGAGGAFAVYEDGLGGNVFVQKISPDGKLLWGNKGTLLGTSGSQAYLYSDLSIVSDNSGGAILAWYSVPPQATQNSRIFHINKVSSNGTILWQKDFWRVDRLISDGSGGAVFGSQLDKNLYANAITSEGDERGPVGDKIAPGTLYISSIVSWEMVTDGEGGAIVVWNEAQYPQGANPGTSSTFPHIYAQRISDNGSILWGDKKGWGNGMSVYVSPTGTRLDSLQATADGDGGVIANWFLVTEVPPDSAGHPSQTMDIVAQKIDGSGNITWQANGIPLEVNKGGGTPRPVDGKLIVKDGTGGAIIGWRDFRDMTTKSSIYAQRIGSDGAILWLPGGVKISNTSLNPRPSMVSAGSDSTIVSYSFQEDGKILHVQKIDLSGNGIWQRDGVSVTETGFAGSDISPDGQGGAIVAWGTGNLNSEKAFVQRVSSDGKPIWGDGIRLNK